MRILFFSFYHRLEIEIHPGIGVLSTVLKQAGHETRLQPYFYLDREAIFKTYADFKPDIVGISATHMDVEQLKKLAPFLKEISDIPVTLGGIFPILEPEKALAIEGIDAICIGEGSKGFLEYVEGRHPATNYRYKEAYLRCDSNQIKIESWSKVPLPEIDYSIFRDCERRLGFKPSKKLNVWTAYTCEYACSFCCNHIIRKTIGLHSKPRITQEEAVEQIAKHLKAHDYKKVHFRDPLFLGPQEEAWVMRFLDRYQKEIGLPYTVNIRADVFHDRIANKLKETGCSMIKMGLETGSEYLRNIVLHKGESNQQFFMVRQMIKKHTLKLSFNAMLGIPYETEETAHMTLQLLKELAPEEAFLHIYQPWPGLKLPKELTSSIRYLYFNAVEDISLKGKLITDSRQSSLDMNRLKQEYVYTPVLDQPSFPYQRALELQQTFIETWGKEKDEMLALCSQGQNTKKELVK